MMHSFDRVFFFYKNLYENHHFLFRRGRREELENAKKSKAVLFEDLDHF